MHYILQLPSGRIYSRAGGSISLQLVLCLLGGNSYPYWDGG